MQLELRLCHLRSAICVEALSLAWIPYMVSKILGNGGKLLCDLGELS